MTTFATFIINGCERVIVSQIVRSPGVYFEKNKNQKKFKTIKRKLSTDIHKLRDFIPLGEPFISDDLLNLFDFRNSKIRHVKTCQVPPPLLGGHLVKN